MGIKKSIWKMKQEILKKAKIQSGTVEKNIKLGDMGSWSLLFGNCDWYVPELDMTVRGTCGCHCVGCFDEDHPEKSACYVANSYSRHTFRNDDGTVGDIKTNPCTVKYGHAIRTIAITMFRKDLLVRLDSQLTKKRDKFETIRVNESGELTCKEDLEMWCELARRHHETTFYLYTKNYLAVHKVLDNKGIPSNMWINISIWHKKGIQQYLTMNPHHPQIRAFVLVDKVWNKARYAKNGIFISGMCPAYDEDGHMNHEVTCSKCKLCYGDRYKIIGCYEH